MTNFASLIDIFRDSGLTQYLTPLRKSGVTSASTFAKCEPDMFRSTAPVADVMLLLQLQARHVHDLASHVTPLSPSTDVTPKTSISRRADFPAPAVQKRANLGRAIAVTNSESEKVIAVSALTNDYYAHSSLAPRDSLWRTWCKLAECWGKAPLPVTVELAVCLGASFKAGCYMSVKNYFSRARSAQMEQLGTPWEPSVEHTVRKVQRSVLRSLGG